MSSSAIPQVELGMTGKGYPRILVRPYEGDWCTRVTSTSKRSRMADAGDKEMLRSNFREDYLYLSKEDHKNIITYYDTVTFTAKKGTATKEMRLEFVIDNTAQSKHANSLSALSLQDHVKIIDGFVTKPEQMKSLVRYQREDKAICINYSDKEDMFSHMEPEDAFKQVRQANVCGFSLLSVMGECIDPNDRRMVSLTTTDGDGIGASADCGGGGGGGLSAQVDGVGLSAQVDGVGCGRKAYHANVMKGTSTGKRFKPVEFNYAQGTRMCIYNVIVMIQEEEDDDENKENQPPPTMVFCRNCQHNCQSGAVH
uniref:Uncharacterized protein n=1 Tax=Carcinus maenas virus 1 TaxID=2704945 RepID=A0A6G9HEQ2_9VIRU|nr:hypothetical protein [Carcinus maenas virus 1]